MTAASMPRPISHSTISSSSFGSVLKQGVSITGSPSPSHRRTVVVISILCTSRPAARGANDVKVFRLHRLPLHLRSHHGGGRDGGRKDTRPPSGCGSIYRASTGRGRVQYGMRSRPPETVCPRELRHRQKRRSRVPASATPILPRQDQAEQREHLIRTAHVLSHEMAQRRGDRDRLTRQRA